MAEKKKSSSSDRSESPKEAAERKAQEQEKQQQEHGMLDNPMLPDQGDEMRHAIYYTAIVGGALVLNFVLLLIVSGGR